MIEDFKVGDRVTYNTYKKNQRGKAVITRVSTAKKNHFYINTDKEGTIMVPMDELELDEAKNSSKKVFNFKDGKARVSGNTKLTKGAVTEDLDFPYVDVINGKSIVFKTSGEPIKAFIGPGSIQEARKWLNQNWFNLIK